MSERDAVRLFGRSFEQFLILVALTGAPATVE
jgi:hypothetical protein